MRTITKDELDIILEKHKSYLVGVDGGERANLSYADLDKRYIQISCVGSVKRITTYCFEDGTIWCG